MFQLGAGAGAEICPEPEPEKSKMTGSGNPGTYKLWLLSDFNVWKEQKIVIWPIFRYKSLKIHNFVIFWPSLTFLGSSERGAQAAFFLNFKSVRLYTTAVESRTKARKSRVSDFNVTWGKVGHPTLKKKPTTSRAQTNGFGMGPGSGGFAGSMGVGFI